MDEDLNLNKFVKLMSTNISDSDLKFANLGNIFGFDLLLYKDLQDSQEEDFTDKIREIALQKLEENNENYLESDDLFYAGSIDFMVSDEPTGRKFFLLETNGGSNRGLSILTLKQQSMMYDGYCRAIEQAIEKNLRGDNKTLTLIGIPNKDGLIHEKVLMIEYMSNQFKKRGYSVGIYNIHTFNSEFKEEIAFLIAEYKQLSTALSYNDEWVKYKDSKLSVLIGDGIARRIPNKEFAILIQEDFRRVKSIIVNPVFRITDDKSFTYLASYYMKNILKKYNLKYLLFTKAYNEKELIQKIIQAINTYRKPFIIKPNGGSGGAGVVPISPKENPAEIKQKIQESEKEFFEKFKENRSPYPYTIQEMADFSLIDWRKGKHTFDIRIYLSQQEKGKIMPIGGLARIARGEYCGNLDKQEFVVNLSGFDGQIEVERGCGLSAINSKLLNLTIDDFVNIYCIGCVMFKSIAKNYQKIIEYSDWDKLIGEE